MHGLVVAELGAAPGGHAWGILSQSGYVNVFSSSHHEAPVWLGNKVEDLGSIRPWKDTEWPGIPYSRFIVDRRDIFSAMVEDCVVGYDLVATPNRLETPSAVRLIAWCHLMSEKLARGEHEDSSTRFKTALVSCPVAPVFLAGWFGESPYSAMLAESAAELEASQHLLDIPAYPVQQW